MQEAPRTEVGGAAEIPWDLGEPVLRRFEEDQRSGRAKCFNEYLETYPGDRLPILREMAHIALELRLKAGEAARAEEYLSQYPELAAAGLGAELAATEARFGRCRVERRAPGSGEVSAASQPRNETTDSLGRYRLGLILGQGTFGTVYRAWDPQLQRDVAIKVCRAGPFALPAERARIEHEARSAARLDHPGIVAIHDVIHEGGKVGLVCDLVDGQTLAERLTAGPMPPRTAARLIAEIADAVNHAHREGVIHRDLKPANILLDRAGKARVTDFGLARLDTDDATRTAEGKPLGTPAYMSPEQARGDGHRVDRRTDVYSLGAILFHALTGAPPFTGGSLASVMQRVLVEMPRFENAAAPVPRDLATVILVCLSKSASDRYATAAELAADLRRYLSNEPILRRRIGPLGRTWRWCRRKPIAAAFCAALVLIACLGSLSTRLAHLNRAQRQRDERRTIAEGKAELVRIDAALDDAERRLTREAPDPNLEDHVKPIVSRLPILGLSRGDSSEAATTTLVRALRLLAKLRDQTKRRAEALALLDQAIQLGERRWNEGKGGNALERQMIAVHDDKATLFLSHRLYLRSRVMDRKPSDGSTVLPNTEAEARELSGKARVRARELAEDLLTRRPNSADLAVIATAFDHFADHLMRANAPQDALNALEYLERSVDLRTHIRRDMNPAHPGWAAASNDLALSYINLGLYRAHRAAPRDLAGARNAYRAASEIYRELLDPSPAPGSSTREDPDHWDRLRNWMTALDNLAKSSVLIAAQSAWGEVRDPRTALHELSIAAEAFHHARELAAHAPRSIARDIEFVKQSADRLVHCGEIHSFENEMLDELGRKDDAAAARKKMRAESTAAWKIVASALKTAPNDLKLRQLEERLTIR